LPDSTLVARKLGSLPRQLCASPAYLAARGWPAQPDDLTAHDWLGGKPGASGTEVLELQGPGGERRAVQLQARVQATQVTALHALCVAGWGISVVVSDDDRRALADGRLLPVMPGWRLDDLPVYAVTPRRGEQPAKVRHAMDLLTAWFAAATAAAT